MDDATLAAARIAALGLLPHPEGGHYRETFRSSQMVDTPRGPRAASTAIYFLLQAHEVSRWHRVSSDEVWHWHAGAVLELWRCPTLGGTVERLRLGPLESGATPQAVVPADCWQAARPVGGHVLVSCTVAPGFDFADFTLLSGDAGEAPWFRRVADPRLVDG